MNNLQSLSEKYLTFCQTQKRLDDKTLKAYRIDLNQFRLSVPSQEISQITSDLLENYIASFC